MIDDVNMQRDAMSCKNNKVRFEASFLMHVVPRPIVVREKKPYFMLKTGAVWRGQKGNHKGNSFPLFGQKIDFKGQE
mgnify:CR=1 FL=1